MGPPGAGIPRPSFGNSRPPGFSGGRIPGMPGPFGDVGRKSEAVGGLGGSEFLKVRSGQAVVGLAWVPGSWAGRTAIGLLDPLFDRGTPPSAGPPMPGFPRVPASAQKVIAREGYAVGGLVVDVDEYVSAVQPVFMRLRPDGKLDPADRYSGPWLGTPAGKRQQSIDGRGAKVIGIHGRGAAVIDAVGLVFE